MRTYAQGRPSAQGRRCPALSLGLSRPRRRIGGFMRSHSIPLTVLLAVWAASPAGAQSGANAIQLVPHRAVYDLSLLRSGGSNGVESARGRIAFDFGGDACEGYTLKYRQVTVLDSNESGQRTLDVRTATFEAADGRSMRFKTDSQGSLSSES